MPRTPEGSGPLTGSRGALHEISMLLGELKAQVAAVSKKVDVEAETAATHRESLRQVIAAQTEATRILSTWKEDWEPLLKEYRQLRSESAGRAKLGRGLIAVLVTLAGIVGAVGTRILDHFWK